MGIDDLSGVLNNGRKPKNALTSPCTEKPRREGSRVTDSTATDCDTGIAPKRSSYRSVMPSNKPAQPQLLTQVSPKELKPDN